MKIKYLVLALAGFCALQPALRVARSCSVPVFRYALERWRPDPYKGIFIYRDKISDRDRALLDQLKEAASNDVAPLNLLIREVDTATFSEEKLKEVLQGPVPDNLPLLIVWYPDQMGKKPPVWKEKLTPSLVEAMLQSPKRQQLAVNLINGESVVWVFIPSGNRKKDEAAKALIQRELDSDLATFMKTPFTILSGAKLKKLPYGFPILTVSPDDPKERVFVETLLKSESDLYEHTDEPMVFPVFGRGRILGCLFGEYITTQHVRQTTAFLAGSCSCEVKNQNPGLDLLIAAPWDMVVMDAFVEDTPLPELTGVMPASIEEPAEAVAPAGTGAEEAVAAVSGPAQPDIAAASVADMEKDPSGGGNNGLLKIYGITLSSALVVVLFAGFILSQRRKKDS